MLKELRQPSVVLGEQLRIFNSNNKERLELCTDVVPPPNLAKSRLTKETQTASILEDLVRQSILENGISAYYEPDVYALGIDSISKDKKSEKLIINARSVRTPDFVSSLFINVGNREMQVIFEPHNPYIPPKNKRWAASARAKTLRYFEKMCEFKMLYPNFYTILISHRDQDDMEQQLPGVKISEVCNEFWHIPPFDVFDTQIFLNKKTKELKARKNVYDLGAEEALFALSEAAVNKIQRFESVIISEDLLRSGKHKRSRQARIDKLENENIEGFTYPSNSFYPKRGHKPHNNTMAERRL